MKRICLSLFVALSAFYSTAQKDVFLTLSPKVNGVDMQFLTDYVDLSGSVFNLDHFNYYVSAVHIIHDGGQDLQIPDTVFLVRPDQFVLYLGNMDVTTIEQINFAIGVPPNVNTETGADAIDISAYPVGHPLSFQDPSMHWGWTAGYMHMIIGGTADSNADGIADAYFELHNVGDLNYRHVNLPVVPTNSSASQIDVYVNCNVDVWLKDIPIAMVDILHGSTGFNSEVMKNVETEVVFTQSGTASVASVYSAVGELFFVNKGDDISVNWKNLVGGKRYILTDMNGKLIQEGVVSQVNGSAVFEGLKSGLYNFAVLDGNSNQLNTLKLVK